jgi:hypothetical protein
MKKIYAVLAVVLLAAAVLSAAEPAPAKPSNLKFGFKAGLSLASFTGSQDTDWKIRAGGIIGGSMALRLADFLWFQSEIFFTQKGASYDGVSNGITSKSRANLSYIEIPILLKTYVPAQSPTLFPNIYAGPFLGLNLSGTYRVEYAGQTSEADIEGLKTLDYGFVLGGGIDILLKSSRLTLDIRYELGLAKIATDWTEKNAAISILVGFMFGK